MIPIIYSVQAVDELDGSVVTQRGLLFANNYSDAVKRIEKQKNIIDIYLTSIEEDTIDLSEDTYNKLLDGGQI